MTFDQWYDDAGSLHVLGRTQTGKTSAAREIHAENQRVSIWLNEQGTDRVPGVAGKRVRSVQALETGLANDVRKFNWLSNDRHSDVQTLREWAWKKADMANRRFPMQLVGDELHRLAPQSQKDELGHRDAVRRVAKEGMKRNVKIVGVTQDPVSVDKQTLRQREYLLCMALSHEQASYLSDYGAQVAQINAQPEYAGIVYHADGSITAEGVKAAGKYAE